MRSVSKLGFSKMRQHVRPIIRFRLSPSGMQWSIDEMFTILTGTGSGPSTMSDANGGEACSYSEERIPFQLFSG